jgi:protein transport protein YIF1
VLFPFQHKSWKRRVHRQADGERYLAPRDDINAPDLYIPAMAFVTYVLIIAFLMGEPWHFSPDVVADQFSRSLMALLFEVVFVKAGFYFLSSASVPLLDIVAFCGYKYVGISLAVVLGFVVRSKIAYLAALLLAAASMAVFVVKSFRLAAPPLAELGGAGNVAGNVAGNGSTNARNYFLLACGLMQIALFYVLGHFAETEVAENSLAAPLN